MTLTDTGPLIALLDKKDNAHQKCLDATKVLFSEVMLTTWPCFTEAMHILGAVGGYRYQAELWRLIENEKLMLHDLSTSEVDKMNNLMNKYQGTPMDLADASLVTVAESLRFRQIFSLDSDFRIYRLSDGSALEIIP